jgi:hypothetical protein
VLPDLRASFLLQRGQSDSIRESLCVLNGLPTRVNLTPVELNTKDPLQDVFTLQVLSTISIMVTCGLI